VIAVRLLPMVEDFTQMVPPIVLGLLVEAPL